MFAMPNTYTQLLFHVIFSTKNRQRTLPDGQRELLYRDYRRFLRENGVPYDERYLA